MSYIREFEGLRGLMALWVVIGHWSTTALIPHAIGATKLYNGYAVDVFVILSGFAITALIDKRPERYSLYLTRRILRIFPVYLFFLALSAFAAPFALHIWSTVPTGYMQPNRIQIAEDTMSYYWPQFSAHVLALHGLVPPKFLPNTDYAFLGQAWSISLEWQFYLIAPFFICWIMSPLTSRRIAIWILSSVALVIVSRIMPMGFLGRHLHNFIIGILSFYLLKDRLSAGRSKALPMNALWLGVVLFSIYMRSLASLPYIIWATVVVTVVRAREAPASGAASLSGLLNSAPVQTLGRMGYSIYLSHMLVILLSLALLQHLHITDPIEVSALLLVLTIVGTLSASFVSYRLIEKPFHELGRGIKWPRPPATAG